MIKPDLVFLWIGDRLPNYFSDTIEIAKKYSQANLILLCSANARLHQLIDKTVTVYELEDFYERDQRLYELEYFGPIHFRNEFWLKTLERYLVLLAFMRHYQKDKFFHAELDNAIFDISELGNCLDSVGKGIFAPRDVIDRAIPSLIYINEGSALEALCSNIFIRSGKKNDMYLLGEFLRDSPQGYSLPTESVFNLNCQWETISAKLLGGIFDANAIGQFVLGIDPRNQPKKWIVHNGFINENIQANLNNCICSFETNGKLNLKMGLQTWRLYNLHIHSKRMHYLLNPQLFNHILNSLANQQRTSFLGLIPHKIKTTFKNIIQTDSRK